MPDPATTMITEIYTESLQQLLASHQSNVSVVLHSRFHLKGGDVVEIQGPPASGKTNFVYDLVFACILPRHLAGQEKMAYLFDLDGTFDIARCHQLLVRRLSSILPTDPPSRLDTQATSCLTRLHIFSPTSTTQLAITILNLGNYQAAQLTDIDIGLVAIDSISAFYWPDRFTVEQLRFTTSESSDTTNPIQSVFKSLRSLQQSYRPIIVLTNWVATPTALSLLSATTKHLELQPDKNSIEPNADSRSMHLTHHVTLLPLEETQTQSLATVRLPGSCTTFVIPITSTEIEM